MAPLKTGWFMKTAFSQADRSSLVIGLGAKLYWGGFSSQRCLIILLIEGGLDPICNLASIRFDSDAILTFDSRSQLADRSAKKEHGLTSNMFESVSYELTLLVCT